MVTVDGRIVADVGVARVQMVVADVHLEIYCLVMPRLVDGFKVILGMDVLRKME